MAAFRRGQWLDARQLLVGLWSEAHTYDVAVTLVQTEYQLEHYAAAAGYLEFALANIPPTEKLSAADEYRKNLLELRQRTTRVRVETEPTAAELRVDGEFIGTSPLAAAIYLDPGYHVIEAQLGALHALQTLDAARGSELAVTLRLEQPTGSPTLRANAAPRIQSGPIQSGPIQSGDVASPPPAYKPNYAPAIVTASVGGAALVAGVVLLLEASHKDSQRYAQLARLPGSNRCAAQNPSPRACGEIQLLADDGRTFRALSLVGFGAAAATGVAAYFLWPRTPPIAKLSVRGMALPSPSGVDLFVGFDGTL